MDLARRFRALGIQVAIGGFLETQMPRGGLEGAQFGERREPGHRRILDEFISS
jgi:hypothetical protein